MVHRILLVEEAYKSEASEENFGENPKLTRKSKSPTIKIAARVANGQTAATGPVQLEHLLSFQRGQNGEQIRPISQFVSVTSAHFSTHLHQNMSELHPLISSSVITIAIHPTRLLPKLDRAKQVIVELKLKYFCHV